MRFRWLALAGFAAAFPLSAEAQMVTAKDPDTVVKALQAGGYTVELAKDSTGDPMIRSTAPGHPFRILFYGCKAGSSCETVQFAAGYDKKARSSLEAINDWNRTKRFGRAYIDADGDPFLLMDVDLDDGGVSSQLFADNLEFWASVRTAFELHIDWAKE
jgi:hypothetical protein